MIDKLLNKIKDKSFDMWGLRIYNAEYREVGWNWYSMVEYFPYYRLYCVHDAEEAYITLKNGTIKLLPNRVYYIPAFHIVSGKCKELKHSFIHFAPVSDLIQILGEYDRVIDIDIDDYIIELFNIVMQNYMKNDVASRFATSGAIQTLLSKFLTESNRDVKGGGNTLLPALKYVDNNINKQITLEELAGVMNYNKTYFANQFKKIYGVSPMQYIINKKVITACRLLTMTDASVKEVAYSLGYDSQFYFSRVFKSKTKLSPLEYKKSQGIGERK